MIILKKTFFTIGILFLAFLLSAQRDTVIIYKKIDIAKHSRDEMELDILINTHFHELQFYLGEKQLMKEKADEVFDLIMKGSEVCEDIYFQKYTQLFSGI